MDMYENTAYRRWFERGRRALVAGRYEVASWHLERAGEVAHNCGDAEAALDASFLTALAHCGQGEMELALAQLVAHTTLRRPGFVRPAGRAARGGRGARTWPESPRLWPGGPQRREGQPQIHEGQIRPAELLASLITGDEMEELARQTILSLQ